MSFHVRAGEVWGAIGPNGSGKTTLFDLGSDPVAGRVGLWSKTDSTSYFKDFVVSPK